mmetsp:Transcript_16787/g.32716  ORF Transcript_16787/g.32716 Transcript_16787/m.32716 type:complete len:84 (-) Transcript_16787:3012-3263(-)
MLLLAPPYRLAFLTARWSEEEKLALKEPNERPPDELAAAAVTLSSCSFMSVIFENTWENDASSEGNAAAAEAYTDAAAEAGLS